MESGKNFSEVQGDNSPKAQQPNNSSNIGHIQINKNFTMAPHQYPSSQYPPSLETQPRNFHNNFSNYDK
jgi:hypothetical protein